MFLRIPKTIVFEYFLLKKCRGTLKQRTQDNLEDNLEQIQEIVKKHSPNNLKSLYALIKENGIVESSFSLFYNAGKEMELIEKLDGLPEDFGKPGRRKKV